MFTRCVCVNHARGREVPQAPEMCVSAVVCGVPCPTPRERRDVRGRAAARAGRKGPTSAPVWTRTWTDERKGGGMCDSAVDG